MAKQRFRDVKQGRIRPVGKKKNRAPHQRKTPDAGKAERFKAFITDSFMLLMPIMYIVFYLVMEGREQFAQQKLLGWLYILLPYVMITLVFLAKTGQTPGMRAYNIMVVDTSAGTIPPPGRLFIRQLLALADFFFFGWIVMFFRSDHRTPHEILTHTSLVRTGRTAR